MLLQAYYYLNRISGPLSAKRTGPLTVPFFDYQNTVSNRPSTESLVLSHDCVFTSV